MKIDPRHHEQFAAASARPMSAADLFLPDMEAVVRHLARMAAERDYKQFKADAGLEYDSQQDGQEDRNV